MFILYVYLALLSSVTCDSGQKELRAGVIERITNGLKMAQDYLGSESVALKVADFVVRAFQTLPTTPNRVTKKPQYVEDYEDEVTTKKPATAEPFAPLRSVVKLLGMDPAQISAAAVNAIIFIAQMISTFLTNHRGSRHETPNRTTEDLNDLIFNKQSKPLQELLKMAKNESLTTMLADIITPKDQDLEETSCVQLLVCKLTPFISKMQDAVFGAMKKVQINEMEGKTSFIYRHLPSKSDTKANGEKCEKLFPKCLLK